MLELLAQYSESSQFFNLFNYITFRTGGAMFTGMIIAFAIGALSMIGLPPGESAFHPLIVARDTAPLNVVNDIVVTPQAALRDLPAPDYICIPDLAIYPGDIGTNGGLRTNAKAQVVDDLANRKVLAERFELSQSVYRRDPWAEHAQRPADWAPMMDLTREAAE